MQEIKHANMMNFQAIKGSTQSIAKLEGQIGHLVVELNKTEEEKLQSKLMAKRHYMIDEDDSINSYHEHVQATATLDSEEIIDNNEEEVKHQKQIEPQKNPNMSNDKEVSTETPSFNVSKSHLMSGYSRTYAHKRANLGTIFLRRSFEASKYAT